MIYTIRRASDRYHMYEGEALEKKPCSKAFSDNEVRMLSDYDFEKDRFNYDDDELEEMGCSKEKEAYSSEWKISLDEIRELDDLVREVGQVVVSYNHIKIYDDYIE